GYLVDPVIEVDPATGQENILSFMEYNPYTSQLIVRNTPANFKVLERHLSEMDTMPKQISIEAKFLTIGLNDLEKIGFNWDLSLTDQNDRPREIESLAGGSYQYDLNGDGTLESIPFYMRPDGSNVITNTITSSVSQLNVSPGPGGTFRTALSILSNKDGDQLSVVFDLLNSLEESELLSAPRVTTMNHKVAFIADFFWEYFTTNIDTEIQTSDPGFGGTPTVSYTEETSYDQFLFGIGFAVMPHIVGDDQVRLWMNPHVSTRGIEKTFTSRSVVGGSEIESKVILPSVRTQEVWTNVIVQDGETLVLGGLVTDQTTSNETGLPYVRDIPIIGKFFQGRNRNVLQSSLLIFVTTDIIDPTGARFFEPETTYTPVQF
ncbi:MAG TPA: hypothetical protein HPP77_03745, partial [Candidatus Hydrogenedentes bacterium]|nr:hypothetical protein [Candidatus Hydrogenedentota bacterium]